MIRFLGDSGLARAAVIGCASSLAACVTLSGGPRASDPSLTCMREAIAALPLGLDDRQAHCRAAGLIARHCSVAEAWLAGSGKELRDLFGPGDVEWKDLRADRAGIACARAAADDGQLARCCTP